MFAVYRQCEYEIQELKASLDKDTEEHKQRLVQLEDKVIMLTQLIMWRVGENDELLLAFASSCCHLKTWAISFTLHYLSSFICINNSWL